ncbi:MAG: VWA domain-containing protein [Desulfomonilaceae bacterium]
MNLDRALQSVERVLGAIGLPAGPDNIINHKTILGCVAGMSGAFLGWFITEPFTDQFPFWRDLYILSGVGFCICLFIASSEQILDRDLRSFIARVRISALFTLFFIIPAVLVANYLLTKSVPVRMESTKVFLLDVSGSMAGERLATLKKAVHAYVDTIEKRQPTKDIKLGCVLFENTADIVANPTTDYKSFKGDIDALTARGSTNMAAGLEFTRNILQASVRTSEVILITDGYPDDVAAVRKMLAFFKENKVPVNTVGTGTDYQKTILEEIAAETNGIFAPADDISTLIPVVEKFAQQGLSKASADPEKKLPIASRLIGWILIGTSIGLCSALLPRSGRTVLFGLLPIPNMSARSVIFGAIGGFSGGLLGAVLFEGLQHAFSRIGIGSGILNRLLGFAILGLCIGFFVNLIEAAVKKVWIRITRGRAEGRLFILDRSPMILGRSEMVDIPVFGDLQIEEENLQLSISGKSTKIATLRGLRNLKVNGFPAREAVLAHLDTFTVGNTEFIYLNKLESGTIPARDT